MCRALRPVLLAFGLLSALPMLARAHSPRRDLDGSFFVQSRVWIANENWPTVRRAHDLSQLDSNAAGAALTLLVGSVAVLAGKRRKIP